METIIINAKNKKESSFIAELLKKLNIEIKVLTEEEKEEIGLIKLMKQADRTQKVSREKVMAKLSRK